MNPLDLRPSEIVWAFWDSMLTLEEDAHRLDVLYFEEEYLCRT
jgi:hypothetical protein